MHFSLPNNRPLEQGGHWEQSDCNLVHQTPKLPAIISSFLHQTQTYTGSQADLSCTTRKRKKSGKWHIFKRARQISPHLAFEFRLSKGFIELHAGLWKWPKFWDTALLYAQSKLPLNWKGRPMFHTKGLEHIPISFLIWLLKSQVGTIKVWLDTERTSMSRGCLYLFT